MIWKKGLGLEVRLNISVCIEIFLHFFENLLVYPVHRTVARCFYFCHFLQKRITLGKEEGDLFWSWVFLLPLIELVISESAVPTTFCMDGWNWILGVEPYVLHCGVILLEWYMEFWASSYYKSLNHCVVSKSADLHVLYSGCSSNSEHTEFEIAPRP